MNKNLKCCNRQEEFTKKKLQIISTFREQKDQFFDDTHDALGKVELEGELDAKVGRDLCIFLWLWFFSPQSFEDSLKVLEPGDGMILFGFASSCFGDSVAKVKLQTRRLVREKFNEWRHWQGMLKKWECS